MEKPPKAQEAQRRRHAARGCPTAGTGLRKGSCCPEQLTSRAHLTVTFQVPSNRPHAVRCGGSLQGHVMARPGQAGTAAWPSLPRAETLHTQDRPRTTGQPPRFSGVPGRAQLHSS